MKKRINSRRGAQKNHKFVPIECKKSPIHEEAGEKMNKFMPTEGKIHKCVYVVPKKKKNHKFMDIEGNKS